MVQSVFLGLAAACLAFAFGYVWAWYRFRSVVDERVKSSLRQSRAVIGGQVAEQLAPMIPGFPGRLSEARFLGSPIDYIVFDGSDDKHIESVTFVEVKSGESSLSAQERHLRDAVQAGNVRWVEHRVDREP